MISVLKGDDKCFAGCSVNAFLFFQVRGTAKSKVGAAGKKVKRNPVFLKSGAVIIYTCYIPFLDL